MTLRKTLPSCHGCRCARIVIAEWRDAVQRVESVKKACGTPEVLARSEGAAASGRLDWRTGLTPRPARSVRRYRSSPPDTFILYRGNLPSLQRTGGKSVKILVFGAELLCPLDGISPRLTRPRDAESHKRRPIRPQQHLPRNGLAAVQTPDWRKSASSQNL